MCKIKVMIVDDHLVVREGLRQLLEVDESIEVVAEAKSGFECLELMEEHSHKENFSPDIIFMDIKMPGINGIETTRLVQQKYPNVKVIMLTIYEDDHFVTEAIRSGANAYVLKNVSRDEMVRIIHHVMEDRAYLDPKVTPTIFDHLKEKGKKTSEEVVPARLTRRELEILNGLVAGLTDRTIAESLYISEHTVRSHIKSLYRKLMVSSRSQAVAKAMRDRIISGNE